MKALKQLRKYHNHNQDQFAEALNISRIYVSKLETGKYAGSFGLWGKISLLYDVPIWSIYYLEDYLNGKEHETDFLPPKMKDVITSIED